MIDEFDDQAVPDALHAMAEATMCVFHAIVGALLKG